MPPKQESVEELALAATPSRSIKTSSSVASPLSSLAPQVGAEVSTIFGRGKVLQVRPQAIQIRLSSWKLAGGSAVICVLNNKDVTVLSAKRSSKLSVTEQATCAAACKSSADQLAAEKRHGAALDLYRKQLAVITVLLQAPTKTSAHRAEWLVSAVAGHNAAAACANALEQYAAALDHVRNAMAIVDALQHQRPADPEQVYSVGECKLLADCRCQSLLLMAQACFGLQERLTAGRLLDQASRVVDKFTADPYADHADYQALQRKLTVHRRSIRRLRRQMRSKQHASAPTSIVTADATTPSSWFRPRRVWFSKAIAHAYSPRSLSDESSASSEASEDDTDARSTADAWYQSPWMLTSAGVVLGTAVVAGYLVRRRR